MDVEFNAIQTAVESKADLNSPTFTGTPAAPTAASGTSSTQLATTAFVAAASSLAVPPGVWFPYGGTTAPTGYLLCNGQAVSRTTYADLFAAIGTTWGTGDGSTTFNVPDIRNRMPIGAGTLYAAAATGGSKDAVAVAHSHTASSDAQGAHQHSVVLGATAGSSQGIQASSYNGSEAGRILTESAGSHSHTITVDSAGVSGTDANLPPYMSTHFIIKT